MSEGALLHWQGLLDIFIVLLHFIALLHWQVLLNIVYAWQLSFMPGRLGRVADFDASAFHSSKLSLSYLPKL